MATRLNIVIVEDHPGFADALKFFLERRLHHNVMFTAYTAKEFYAYHKISDSDIVFMDIELPDENGINIAKETLLKHPFLKIIGMTMYEDDVYLAEIVSAGFKGALFKTNFCEYVRDAIEKVNNGKLYFPKNIKINRL